MNYGFVIDARKCIGCHACTVACKSENQVPLGVNRTWVKYVEKGTFPDTRRYFTVLRCNHCAEPPCVDICPVEALQKRPDGIVDFDSRRCIGCKACAQACPYNALYIDPDTHTSAKCNYCAHRKEVGLQPACVTICPQQAIVSGDLDDPSSKIAALVASERTVVRKPEKGTSPKLYYINGDGASLDPLQAPLQDAYHWSAQTRGVGHFAGKGKSAPGIEKRTHAAPSAGPKVRRVYDIASKGAVWGWEVPAYVTAKAVSSGVFLVFFALLMIFRQDLSASLQWASWAVSLVFLALTGGFLVKDLDRPDRFSSVMLRPQFGSWLVRGGLTITGYGALLALWGVGKFLQVPLLEAVSLWGGALFALVTAIYTAFLFGAAKGRDFWQSPMLLVHMLLNSLLAGGSAMLLIGFGTGASVELSDLLTHMLVVGFGLHIAVMLIELFGKHPSVQAERAAEIIREGSLKNQFWVGSFFAGNLVPMVLALVSSDPFLLAFAALLGLCGVFYTEKVWVQAPQRIPLS
ncbi:MAG: polysulfide reductase NrfD [Chlorobium sp.]|uniref:4Fe-4S dicluster domain-containing protein n=1 Tax=Chlorobium sp. TaxID=1095 RepID=UPI0025BEDDDA|nr:4Fe-4S dicluster domain-containing protein [Chlorobium sp.]MCF8216640.1 polysulfide reductase NrfD [Chlorobium sp.]MCF8271510.1 polysulfide reductase NrfD [Chlorobium sp.]MCF8287882.1 polysulfide reductase NrfD [Chlorobium sp.]MCF8291429.1 polysulfide reductase NrfD [Chlorobium sp.]MCF8385524.1 polysulfide reductase NrfD [Chlorobium sp.]